MENKVDIVILTALPEEYDAVVGQLSRLESVRGTSIAPNTYAWQMGTVSRGDEQGIVHIAVGMIGRAGTNQSAIATVEAVRRWSPRYVFFVGVAGGLGELRKGDVVLADIVYGYEYGKLEKRFLPRSNWTYRTDLALLNGANAFALSSRWQAGIRAVPPAACVPSYLSGEVASGDKVVDDKTNSFFAQVLRVWPKLRAVEMEGAGVANAIEYSQSMGIPIGFTVVRGVSDVPRPADLDDPRGTAERDAWKRYAAESAAVFAIGFIASSLFPVQPARVPVGPSPRIPTSAGQEASGTSPKATVFISYLGQDVETAEKLATEIRNAGHTVWLSEWELRVGDSIVEKIDAGLDTAAWVVVCYSNGIAPSQWMNREWMSGLARQIGGQAIKLLPVRLTGGRPPPILADLKYADLVKDWSSGVRELLRAME